MLLYHRAQNNWNTDIKAQTCLWDKGGLYFWLQGKKAYSEDAGENKDCLIVKKKPDWGSVTSEVTCNSCWEKRHWPNSHGNNTEISIIVLVCTQVHFCCPDRNCIKTINTGFACLPYYYHLPNTYPGAKKLLSHCSNSTAASVQSPRECSGSDFHLQGLLAALVLIKHLATGSAYTPFNLQTKKTNPPVLELKASDKHLLVRS